MLLIASSGFPNEIRTFKKKKELWEFSLRSRNCVFYFCWPFTLSKNKVGPSLSSAPLTWKNAWNSVLIIRNLPLVPPVLCLMWFLRVLSYLSLEFLTHALLEIIVQPNSMHPALLKKPLSSCWLLIASRSI